MSRKILLLCVVLTSVSGGAYLAGSVMGQPGIIRFLEKVGLMIGSIGATSVWSARRLLGERRADGFVVNLIVFVTTSLLLLGLGEVAMRLLLSNVTTTPDNSSYFARQWDRREVRRNALGFRERKFARNKPPNVFRIAVIGDSFTFGQGVAEGERYTNLLEVELNREAGPYRFEVLNFGRPGAQTIDHIEILDRSALDSQPDFILLQWYVNDPQGKDGYIGLKTTPLFGSSTLKEALHHTSALYSVADIAWSSLQERFGWLESTTDYMVRRFEDSNNVDSREAARLLREFIDLCRKNGKPLGIVLFPKLLPELRTGYKLAFLHERVLGECTRVGIECVDLRAVFAEFTDARTLWASRFDNHPGPVANRIAADQLHRHFASVWVAQAQRGHAAVVP